MLFNSELNQDFSSKFILITGGFGYIGSAITLFFLKKNYKIIVIDKELPQSYYLKSLTIYLNKNEIKEILKNTKQRNLFFFNVNLNNIEILELIFKNFNIEAVIHCAASIEVGLSITNPASFYQNNVGNTIQLLNMMKKYNVKKIIFSSSAAVYGIPKTYKINEDCLKNPINPYGRTKVMAEMILKDFVHAYQMQAISLRFFNASGALEEYDIGERHNPETHLIPLILKSIFEKSLFYICGNDYSTQDGTCIRDYVHINDIANAHYYVLKYLEKKNAIYDEFNIGSGIGYSIKEIINIIQKISGKKIHFKFTQRRTGDPDQLIADIKKAEILLNWKPIYSLEDIIKSAHNFHLKVFKINKEQCLLNTL